MKWLLVLLLSLTSCFAQEPMPQRIVSLSLCTDQLLLMLAPRQHIAALTQGAKDPHLSYMAAESSGFLLTKGRVEEVLSFNPDLIVGSTFASQDSVHILKQLGYPVKLIGLPVSTAGIRDLLLTFGQWIGSLDRAEKVVEKMNRQLTSLNLQQARVKKTALIYSPNGYTMGSGTLENVMLNVAGFHNLAVDMGVVGFEQITLEQVVAAQPEFLFIDNPMNDSKALASQYINHPVLDKMLLSKQRQFIPYRLRACAGPMVVEGINYLSESYHDSKP